MYEYLSLLHPRMGMSIEIFVTNVLDNPSLHPRMRMCIEIHVYHQSSRFYVASLYEDEY